MARVSQNRIYIYTVHDRVVGDIPAKNTVCKPYIYVALANPGCGAGADGIALTSSCGAAFSSSCGAGADGIAFTSSSSSEQSTHSLAQHQQPN